MFTTADAFQTQSMLYPHSPKFAASWKPASLISYLLYSQYDCLASSLALGCQALVLVFLLL